MNKTAMAVLILVAAFIGVFVYLINGARGGIDRAFAASTSASDCKR